LLKSDDRLELGHDLRRGTPRSLSSLAAPGRTARASNTPYSPSLIKPTSDPPWVLRLLLPTKAPLSHPARKHRTQFAPASQMSRFLPPITFDRHKATGPDMMYHKPTTVSRLHHLTRHQANPRRFTLRQMLNHLRHRHDSYLAILEPLFTIHFLASLRLRHRHHVPLILHQHKATVLGPRHRAHRHQVILALMA
jgi:hypothetical protein